MHHPAPTTSRRTSTLLLCATLVGTACSGATTGGTGSTGDTGTSNADSDTTSQTAGDETAGTCGNGAIDGDEPCDGEDLGGQSCAAGGTLVCTPSCTLDTSGCTVDPTMAVVRFNEIVSDEVTAGPYAGAADAMELHNLGGAAADLSGWRLSDDPTFPADKTYTFPDGISLAPGGVLVLVQLEDATGVGDYPFGISSNDPETLTLVNGDAATVDVVSLLGPDATVSWCRLPDGDGEWQVCAQTLGELNAGDTPPAGCGDGMVGGDEDCDGQDLGGLSACGEVDPSLAGPLSCTALCTLDLSGCDAVPTMGVVLNELTSAGDDEIELYNYGSRAIDLSAYILTDDLADPDDAYDFDADLEKLVFAPGTVLDPGDYLVVIQGGAADEHPFGLGDTGDAVTLLTPGLGVVDFVEYGDAEAGDSYCRLPDGPRGEWTAGCTPSFGDPNTP